MTGGASFFFLEAGCFVTLSLDADEIRDQRDSVRLDLFSDRLLIVNSGTIKVLARSILLVTNVVFDAGDVDTHGADRYIFNLAVLVALVQMYRLDTEHVSESAYQCIDELLLLRIQKRPALQLGESDVDLIDCRCQRVGHEPPFGRWQILGGGLLLDVRYDLLAMLFVKVEDSTEIHSPVCLL